ncbi:adenylate/guanylate cyclase domain-containing protein [Bosea caraganae]|uniref:Adenylate/guanylate cyclase domain-containing protein n=1 Tax=Bosea caraganae TaxID=2763117 RepID=A0A370LA62_9HYPH|nr:adenylate/guanylate cyclase domain-containing protein [Bosea caraganae]RDJ28109.1 adenylate/guanylate cyclase domain-containing protein [Bosea caraganae]
MVVAALALLAGLWAGLLGWSHLAGERSPLDGVEAQLADMRLLIAGRREPPPAVVIVAIDDRTVAGERGYPLSRQVLAKLVDAIAAGKARALAIDLLLLDAGVPENDRALAEALSRIPSVIAAAGRFDRANDGASSIPGTSDVLWPASPFDSSAMPGLVNISTDSGGAPRHLPLLFQTDHGLTPAFVLRAVTLFTGQDPVFGADRVQIAERSVALDLGFHLPLRFYGPRGAVETLSAAAVLAGSVPTERLRDRIVVIGATATAVGDTFGTPFDPVTPGVEVLATGIAQLLGGPGLVRDGAVRRVDAGMTLALAVFGALTIALTPLSLGTGLVALVTGAWLLATIALFAQGYWFSGVLPLAGMLPPAALAMALRQHWERRQSRGHARAEAALRQFQPPVLAERIARDPDFLRQPVMQSAAILFVDLSGFTRLSEQAGPAQTREFLKEFHTLVENEIAAHDGLVMTFMGDGAMIVFGIPEARPDDATRAFAAAWDLIGDVRSWIDKAELAAGHPDLRVGAHFGQVVVSRLGHETHQHIMATGDSVNVASRLMEVAKEHGAALAVSAEFMAALGEGGGRREPDDTRAIDIRGRRQPISVALWRMRQDAH